MTVIRQNRRQFLQGVGGFTLALPFLPSLVEKAHAQAFTPAPRMVVMATQHGAALQNNMFPTASTPFSIFSDHAGRQSPLSLKVDGSNASLSPVLTAPSSVFTPALVKKMNTLCGIDMPFDQGHHWAGYLGNHAMGAAMSDPNHPVTKNIPMRPTLDQIMAWSSNFYKDLSVNRLRSMHVGSDLMSWGWANPKDRTGAIVRTPATWNSQDLFNNIFVAPKTTTSTRVPVVDRVFASYQRLRNGQFGDAQRISAADKLRLDDHMQRLSELQRRVSVVASCENVKAPTNVAKQGDSGVSYETVDYKATIKWYQTFNDVIVAAFICGTSRIAIINSPEQWHPYSAGSWHQNIAHTCYTDPNTQKILVEGHRQEFESLFLDLVSKLDVEEADGKTYLDNSLVWWTQESGFSTHAPVSMPIVTAGSAAGYFKTGYAVDYRRLESKKWNNMECPGILYAQWLANVAQSMGLTPQEYHLADTDKGYGNGWRQPDWAGPTDALWPARLFDMADSKLPFIIA